MNASFHSCCKFAIIEGYTHGRHVISACRLIYVHVMQLQCIIIYSKHCHRFSCAAMPGVGCRAHFIKSPQCCFGNLDNFPWRWKSHGCSALERAMLGFSPWFFRPWKSPKRPATPGCQCGRYPDHLYPRNSDGGGGLLTCLPSPGPWHASGLLAEDLDHIECNLNRPRNRQATPNGA